MGPLEFNRQTCKAWAQKREYLHMRKKNDTLLNTGAAHYGRKGTIAGVILASLIACAILMSHLALLNYGHTSSTILQPARDTNAWSAQGSRNLCHVLKVSHGVD